MNKVMKLVVMVGILLTLVLTSACTLRASRPPSQDVTATSELQFLTPTSIADALSTQTAAAIPAIATATPEPIVEQPTAAPPQQESSRQAAGRPTQGPAGSRQQPSPSPPSPARSTYTIQKGEWPICIARRYDLNLSSLLSLNGMNMNYASSGWRRFEDPLHGQLGQQRSRLALLARAR